MADLAGILQFCDAGKKKPAASFEERALQNKMVAGARNYLFRTHFRWFRNAA